MMFGLGRIMATGGETWSRASGNVRSPVPVVMRDARAVLMAARSAIPAQLPCGRCLINHGMMPPAGRVRRTLHREPSDPPAPPGAAVMLPVNADQPGHDGQLAEVRPGPAPPVIPKRWLQGPDAKNVQQPVPEHPVILARRVWFPMLLPRWPAGPQRRA